MDRKRGILIVSCLIVSRLRPGAEHTKSALSSAVHNLVVLASDPAKRDYDFVALGHNGIINLATDLFWNPGIHEEST
jgi:hypothetical protein